MVEILPKWFICLEVPLGFAFQVCLLGDVPLPLGFLSEIPVTRHLQKGNPPKQTLFLFFPLVNSQNPH